MKKWLGWGIAGVGWLVVLVMIGRPIIVKFDWPEQQSVTGATKLSCQDIAMEGVELLSHTKKGAFQALVVDTTRDWNILHKWWLVLNMQSKREEESGLWNRLAAVSSVDHWKAVWAMKLGDFSESGELKIEHGSVIWKGENFRIETNDQNYLVGILVAERPLKGKDINTKLILLNKNKGLLTEIESSTWWFLGQLENMDTNTIWYRCDAISDGRSNASKADELLRNIEEVKKIIEKVQDNGNNVVVFVGGENNGEVEVVMSENLSDHTSRIATFYVHVPTGVITIEDVVQNKRISLEEWKKQVRESWGF